MCFQNISGRIQFLLTRLSRGVTDWTRRGEAFLKFLLTRLSRGVTRRSYQNAAEKKFLLTRLSRGVTTSNKFAKWFRTISTHTPLARRDLQNWNPCPQKTISTHTPLARRDRKHRGYSIVQDISTHTPLARRDQLFSFHQHFLLHFYSHASREA